MHVSFVLTLTLEQKMYSCQTKLGNRKITIFCSPVNRLFEEKRWKAYIYMLLKLLMGKF